MVEGKAVLQPSSVHMRFDPRSGGEKGDCPPVERKVHMVAKVNLPRAGNDPTPSDLPCGSHHTPEVAMVLEGDVW